jgi:hypothetical protein
MVRVTTIDKLAFNRISIAENNSEMKLDCPIPHTTLDKNPKKRPHFGRLINDLKKIQANKISVLSSLF